MFNNKVNAAERMPSLWRLVIAVLILVWLFFGFYQEHDDTDFPDSRSGLTVKTDALTGCQYLGSGFGGVTPRLDAAGKQLGCRS